MKKNYLFRTVLSILFIMFSCVSFAKEPSTNDAMCKKLETFYKEYYRLMNSDDPKDYPNEIIKLTEQYCTKKFAENIKNEFLNKDGVDYLMIEHLDNVLFSTFSISKAEGYYKVSFDDYMTDSIGNKIKKIKVILAVYLKDGLIDNVKELQGWEH